MSNLINITKITVSNNCYLYLLNHSLVCYIIFSSIWVSNSSKLKIKMALFGNISKGFRRCLSLRYNFRHLSQSVQQTMQNDNTAVFPGARCQWTDKLQLTHPESISPFSVYRVLDDSGKIINDKEDPNLSQEIVEKMYKDMLLLNIMDKILYESQRQGRISFYMTNYGEEASHIGSAAGLSSEDLVYAQYREAGVLVWRGFSVPQFINQCYGNCEDTGKGRQMPVHYGDKNLNFITISSPLGTQMPQAVGAAYGFKRLPSNDRCVITYFGDGAASEGDAHAAFNFSATLECPIIFFCRNNGFAISTTTDEQYRGDGIASRGPGYGIATLRFDGTDVFAVYNATKAAREYAINNNKPVLLEAMAYRVGHHSTSDDSSVYRSSDEVKVWNDEKNPVTKLRMFMESKGWWTIDQEKDFIKDTKKHILNTITDSEKKLKSDWSELFHDVYYDMPEHIESQMKQMKEHVNKYKDHYPLENFKSS